MGLLQDIEGLFGFGKKAATPQLAQADVQAAISVGKNFIAIGEQFIGILVALAKPYPPLSAVIGVVKVALDTASHILDTISGFVSPNAPSVLSGPPQTATP
jgi:hypothetical protein